MAAVRVVAVARAGESSGKGECDGGSASQAQIWGG